MFSWTRHIGVLGKGWNSLHRNLYAITKLSKNLSEIEFFPVRIWKLFLDSIFNLIYYCCSCLQHMPFQSALSGFLLIRTASCIVCRRSCLTSRLSLFPNPNATMSTISPWPADFTPCIDRPGGCGGVGTWSQMSTLNVWQYMLWDTGTFDQQPIPSSISIMLANEQRAQSSAFQGKKHSKQQKLINSWLINHQPQCLRYSVC